MKAKLINKLLNKNSVPLREHRVLSLIHLLFRFVICGTVVFYSVVSFDCLCFVHWLGSKVRVGVEVRC